MQPATSRHLIALLRRFALPLILLLAVALRFWALGFGFPYVMARPDETQIAGPAVGFLSGDLTPEFLQWPTLFPYAVALVYASYALLTRPFGGFPTLAAFAESRRQGIEVFLYLSRGLSALMGVVGVWGVYAIGRRAFDRTVGLAAALFLAVAFLHVRDSHFGVTDVPMTSLVVLAVAAIVRWRQTGGVWMAAAAGAMCGLAGSTKYNGLGTVVPFAVALAQRTIEEWRSEPHPLRRNLAAAVGFGVAMPAAFFAASPYILIHWDRFVVDISRTQTMLETGHGMRIGQGWGYFASVVLPAAVGMPMFVAAVAGAIAMLALRFRESAAILAFPIAYYAVAGRGYGVFSRYMVPMIPFICLSAAWLTVTVARAIARSWPAPRRQFLVAAMVLAVAAPTMWKTFLLERLLAATDNRVVVARALFDAMAPGSSFYQTGEPYGHVPLVLRKQRADVGISRFDPATASFQHGDPEWVLVQRSPLVLYSSVPPELERVLSERYELTRGFPTRSRRRVDMIYDQQDAFYLPLDGLEGIDRPGPEFELYRRR